ncbi:hypothetical protein PR048_008410 [Dryococelus australis]|uniref:Uncharacterized protein n=1 Tax=Dryococelus australis TaxID=614101 RepID=A0ABQ9HX19_9NEOP|nr:hypothetical protein PR048_008410 [Dryococelus australis]
MRRLLEQKLAIILSASEIKRPVELSQSQWELMKMNIFDHAALVVSSSNVTASEIIPIVNSTKWELEKVVSKTSVVNAIKNDLASLKVWYSDVEENQFYIVATILEPRLKTSVFSSDEYATNARRKLINAADLHELPAQTHWLR